MVLACVKTIHKLPKHPTKVPPYAEYHGVDENIPPYAEYHGADKSLRDQRTHFSSLSWHLSTLGQPHGELVQQVIRRNFAQLYWLVFHSLVLLLHGVRVRGAELEQLLL